jgi:hypothetical protein
MHATPWAPAGAATARSEGRVEAGGTALLLRYAQERDGAVSFEALNVFTADPQSADVLLYSFDSAGYPPDPPARGRWDGDELVLIRETARGSARTVYAPVPGGYRWRKDFRAPGEADWSPLVDGVLLCRRATSGS